MIQSLQKYQKLFKYLPTRIDKLLKKVEAGELSVKMDVRGATHLESRLDGMMKRLEFGVIISALILAASLIYLSSKSMGTANYIFTIFVILLIWIIVNFFRNIRDDSKKKR
jgi:hypothetical protein